MGKAVDALAAKVALSQMDDDDLLLIGLKGKLDWSPKHNWVEDNGGLPKFIEDMAVHIMDNSGLERSHAIAAAVQRTKVLAGKGNRRATQALAQWEKLKGSAAAKRAAKKK